jgi:plastocyanin
VKRLALTLALAAVAIAAAACSTTNAGEPSGATVPPADPDAPAVVARDMRFAPSEVVVPAGKAFQLAFDNQDGAPHNVAVYADASAGQNLFRGDIVTSSGVTYQVPALAAGTYFFRCDVHPDMTGSIVAK